MDMGHEQLVLGACIVLVAVLVHILFLKTRASHVFPRGPFAWPILGHLPLLLTGCPHQTLSQLSRKHGYGPIIGLRLGSQRAVVISSPSLAREFLLSQDKIFANRPHYQFADALLFGFDNFLSFSSYGPNFARFRKIYTLELFNTKRLHELEYIRQEELRTLLHRLRSNTQAVNLGVYFAEMMINTMSRLLQSKSLSEAAYLRGHGAHGCDSLPELIEKFVHEVAPTLGDFIPWLKCMDLLQKRNMKCMRDCLDKIIDCILLERRLAMQSHLPHELPRDLLQVLLSKEAPKDDEGLELQTNQEDLLTTQQIKAIMVDILLSGSHTTSLTLEWAMAELLRSPHCLGKLRDEIDEVMGKGDALVTDADLPKLPYLESTVKEVLRLHPVAPLLIPRVSSQATKVEKYTLPTHTHVFVNVWALGRDPHVWEQAETFLPERFQGMDMDVKGQHYDLLPFGSGRRICPGLRLGMSSVQVTLANLVKAFDWELPQGQTHTDIDMSGKRGITNGKATPLLAIPKPRLASHLELA